MLAVLAIAVAGLGAVSAYRSKELPAQAPDILFGKLHAFHPGGSRHLPDGPYLLVAFPDGKLRYLRIGDRDDRGCRTGSRVAIERRGTRLSLAPTVCPDARDRTW